MQKIEKFLGKAPMWKVSLIMMLLMYGMTAGFLLFLSKSVDVEIMEKLRMMPVIVGVILGNLAAVMIYHMRKSEKFWDEAKRIEEIIKTCKDPIELGRIVVNDIQGLYKLSIGLPHDVKIRELKKLANVRADTILEFNEVNILPTPTYMKVGIHTQVDILNTVPGPVMAEILKHDPNASFSPKGIITTRLSYDTIKDIIDNN
jgi:hypothetical protein